VGREQAQSEASEAAKVRGAGLDPARSRRESGGPLPMRTGFPLSLQSTAGNRAVAGLVQRMAAEMERHVFKGDRHTKLAGFHSVADTTNAELKPIGSPTNVGSHGAYEQPVADAKYNVGDKDYKTKKGGKSTFFPSTMTKKEVEQAVVNAVGNKVVAPGKSWDGMKIQKGTGAYPLD
jgi:hypothetical protein